jgi:hypothetical protein
VFTYTNLSDYIGVLYSLQVFDILKSLGVGVVFETAASALRYVQFM